MERDRGEPVNPPPMFRDYPGGLRAALARRWRGDVPLGQAFWCDMVLVGSAVNVAATLAAVLVLALKGPTWAVVLFYSLPVPLNLFVFVEVLRASRESAPGIALAAQAGAMVWLILAVAF